MHTTQLLKRNLTYYWRTNLAVIAGVSIAVAVLGGALLVGGSVRASLRNLVEQRLGSTDYVVSSTGFFREELATEIRSHKAFATPPFVGAVPLIALPGTLTHEASKRVAANVLVYGVDDRFWRFHNLDTSMSPSNRELLISEGLGQELGSNAGDSVLLRIQKPTDIPIESLHSKKDDLSRTLRLTLRQTLSGNKLGEFSLQPQQGSTRAAFVPLEILQRELEKEGGANLILINEANSSSHESETLAKIVEETATLDDFGITLHQISDQRSIALEHESRLIAEPLEQAASGAANSSSLRVKPIFSYLANRISANGRSIPYSLVIACDEQTFKELASNQTERAGSVDKAPIILNDWAAKELNIHPEESVQLEYYYWSDAGKLETRSAEFYMQAVVPIEGIAADRDLVPNYPGISGSEDLADWDPPFPVDLNRIRKQDEDYWDQYGTTPKAFIPLSAGRELWSSRFGQATSLRLVPTSDASISDTLEKYKHQLSSALDPAQMGFVVIPVREQGLAASQGATDFGEYFLYFSFFLVVSALLLTALFFKLGVEQRLREIGLLQAIGFPAVQVRNLFLIEGIILCVIGSIIGIAGAIAYGYLMMRGLTTWWVDAVGTTNLKLHISPLALLLGAMGGVIAAVICIVWTLRRLRRVSTRSLLMGSGGDAEKGRRRGSTLRWLTSLNVAVALLILGFGFLTAAALNLVGQVGGFFGGGSLLLASALCFQSAWLRRQRRRQIQGNGWSPIMQLGFRNTTYRPGRSVLCIALIASAAFIIVSVDAFRRAGAASVNDRKSGTGGFPLLAESLVPLAQDPNSNEGKEALNLAADGSSPPMAISRFRFKPGDDASCLNLYQPRDPRVVAPRDDFIQSNRFAFANTLAETADQKSNPWTLLKRKFDDGAIPVFADANSMTYVLHLKLGEDFILNRQTGAVRLRIVGGLADSVFQSELIMSEENFIKLFPEHEGYRFFLIDTTTPSEVATLLEERLSDFGFDVESTADRLANFHRVENTYLSTFQMLGGLGLLLGTLGLAAVLLRNVLERRRELALLRAVGYNSTHFAWMVIAENAMLLFCGLATGTVCALLAIAPVFFERGGRLPNVSLGLLLLAVLISGLIASVVATWAALRTPLLPALRAE